MPARTGYAVCFKHGAGTRARERSGERRRPGRPPVHGLYAEVGRAAIRQRIETLRQAEEALDNSDEALLTLKATHDYLFDLCCSLQAELAALGGTEAMPTEGDQVGGGHQSRRQRVMNRLYAALEKLTRTSLRVVLAVKYRADTRAKTARDEGAEEFRDLLLVLRGILWDLLDDAQLAALDERVNAEILLPRNVPPTDLRAGQRESFPGSNTV
jgi:hypothetical protein